MAPLASTLRKAVEIEAGIQLSEKTKLFQLYHSGNRGVNQNRKMEEQLKDWMKIENFAVRVWRHRYLYASEHTFNRMHENA